MFWLHSSVSVGLPWFVVNPSVRANAAFPPKMTAVPLFQCSVSCGGGVRIRSVTCAKNHNEPCDVTRKPNSRALCGLQQCPSSRRAPNPSKVFTGKRPPTSERDPVKPIPSTTPGPRMLTTPSVPEPVTASAVAVNNWGPTPASKGAPDRNQWQNSSTHTALDTDHVISTGTTSQPILTTWLLSIQPKEEHVSNADPGPISEGDIFATTGIGSDLSSSSNPMTWQVTPFYNTLSKEPDTEVPSGSGEDREQPENTDGNDSVIWTKTVAPGNDASGGRSTGMPFGPPPTPYLWGASLWPPVSTVSEGLLPSQGPTTLKNGTPRAEGMITGKPTNALLPLGGEHQPAPSEKPVNHDTPALPSNLNLTQSSEPVLTEEDATSLIAEGFLLNVSNYKQLSSGRSSAHWVVGNWSEVGVPWPAPCLCLSGK